MRRFLSVYRWELTLVVGIPVVTGVVAWAAVWGTSFAVGGWYYSLYQAQPVGRLLGTIATVALLAVFFLPRYDRVRRQWRDLLALLWRYSLWAAVVKMLTLAILYLVQTVSPRIETAADVLVIVTRQAPYADVGFLLQLGVLLWFARQASRHSLMHMCFVVVWAVAALGLGSIQPTLADPSWWVYAVLLASWVVGLAMMLVKVWLLGNFERRGLLFRRNAVLALVATTFVSGYAGMLMNGAVDWSGFYTAMLFPLFWVGMGKLQYAASFALYDLARLVALAANTAFELMALAVLLGIAYLVRVRPPRTPAKGQA